MGMKFAQNYKSAIKFRFRQFHSVFLILMYIDNYAIILLKFMQ